MNNKEELYQDAEFTCSCGATFNTKSTKKEFQIEVCSACHPFYTGKQIRASKAGKVEKFRQKYGLDEEKKETTKKEEASEE